ncbi:hypothetical protein [Hymenobacter elongatus]|uniref:Uncharacterized protein n=1 Tax=Hymenobacter elongatus TaxID=877208 RepID=A0A4Z0PNP5_9BACT|nr:hypothetical protein [Hymenobacter elongatus]TGE16850.1 hypothetical protein E5J99_09080 [Hymenobacter elongatus]
MRNSTHNSSLRLSHLLRAAGLVLALLVLTPTAARAQTWMVSTDAYIKMGVMDKFGQLGTYTARFVVISQTSGKEFILVKQIEKGQNGIDVIFPSEPADADYFKTESGEAAKGTPGRYTWECQVAGKKVVGGRFTFPEVGNDVTVVDRR